MTDTVFDGVQTRLTHNLSFLLLSLSFHSVPLRLSLYLHPTLACRGSSQFPRTPPPPPHGLIVLHLFIRAFMATSSSCGLISSADDGSLLRLSPLFIIGVHSHHISLTLGRWFSHWTTLPARHLTNVPRGAQGKRPQTVASRADLIASKNATRHVHGTIWTCFYCFPLIYCLIFPVRSVMSSG